MLRTNEKKLISIVAPCHDESDVFPALRAELVALADRLASTYDVEILLVDDGSRDDTWAQIAAFCAADARVRGLSLSRNFGHQAALSSAYEAARGDAVVSIDADLQDPLHVIDAMLRAWEDGADVVFGIRSARQGETRFKRWTAALFYRMLGSLGAGYVKPDSGDFRLMSRRSLDALVGMKEYHRFIRGMVGWIGFKTADVHYVREARRAGVTKYPLRKMVRLAADALISFSYFPLRVAYIAAALISVTFLAYLVVTLVRVIVFGEPLVPGWSSLILAVVGFGAANLVCLGIIGEYVGRIYEQSKERPLYLVQSKAGVSTASSSTEAATTERRSA